MWWLLVAAVTLGVAPAQGPVRVTPGEAPAVKPVFRELKPGEQRIEGLLQRVECPTGRPVTFIVKTGTSVAKYQAPRLDAVEYIAYTPDFKAPMTCGGRGKGDPVLLTWKTVANAPRVVVVEFIPRPHPEPKPE